MALLIEQVFSQRTWPGAGDVDDCWVVSAIQCADAVAPWLTLLTVRQFRAHAGDPDDDVADGGNVADLVQGIGSAWPRLAPLCTPVRGDRLWVDVLAAIKAGRPMSLCVSSAKLTHQYGFSGLHQVTVFWDGISLRVANPLAADRSIPTRILGATLQAAAQAYGNGKVYGVLFPTQRQAFTTHPFYVAPGLSQAEVDAAVAAATAEATARIETMQGLAGQIVAA
jgi:hypothetical protein